MLGWGSKTITRYESHQVQDRAHDTILKKISHDPDMPNSMEVKCFMGMQNFHLTRLLMLFDILQHQIKSSICIKSNL